MGTQHTVRGKFSPWMGTVVIRGESPPSTGGEEAAGLREIRPARYSVEMRCPSGYSDIFIPDRNASQPLTNKTLLQPMQYIESHSPSNHDTSHSTMQVWCRCGGLRRHWPQRGLAGRRPIPSLPLPRHQATRESSEPFRCRCPPYLLTLVPSQPTLQRLCGSANPRVPELLSVSSKGRVACHG
jgi:hypothetical protein